MSESKSAQPAYSPRKQQSPLRWLLYLGSALFFGGLLIVLSSDTPQISAAIFVLLLLASALYLLFKYADAIGRGLQAARQINLSPSRVQSKTRVRLTVGFGLAAITIAIASAALFWEARSYDFVVGRAAWVFLASNAALWVALLLQPDSSPIPHITLSYPVPEPAVKGFAPTMRLFLRRVQTRGALFVGLLLMLILTMVNAQFIKSDLINQTPMHVQYGMLILAVVLLTIGLSGVRVQAVQRTFNWRGYWHALWPLGVITLLALALRLWQLDSAMRFLVDERSFVDASLGARGLKFYGLLQPFSGIAAFPYIYPYWQSITIELLGRNLVGFRAASAVVGTLTVPALYLLAQALFDRKTALLAALLLATFPPHLQFSRIGLNNIADPLIGTWALAFLSRGLRYQSRTDFALAGIMLGFTQYFYEGGRLLLIPLVLVWFVAAILFARVSDARPGLAPWTALFSRFWRVRSSVMVVLFGLVIIGVPIYLTLVGIQRPILPRFVGNGLGLGWDYWENVLYSRSGLTDHITQRIIPAFGMYFYRIDHTFFYSKTTSLLLSGMQIAVIIGFGVVVFYWRKAGPMLLILWVICTPLANTLMKNSVSSTRFLIVLPALTLLAAIGIRYAVPLVVRRIRWQVGVMAALGIMLALYQVNFYFNLHLPEYNYAFRFSNAAPDGYDAAWRSLRFPERTQVHLISTPAFNQIEAEGVIRVWRDDIVVDALQSRYLTPNYLKSLKCGVDHAFYVQKKDTAVLNILHRFFNLSPAQYTPYNDLAVSERMVLYYADYDPTDGSVYSRRCLGLPYNES